QDPDLPGRTRVAGHGRVVTPTAVLGVAADAWLINARLLPTNHSECRGRLVSARAADLQRDEWRRRTAVLDLARTSGQHAREEVRHRAIRDRKRLTRGRARRHARRRQTSWPPGRVPTAWRRQRIRPGSATGLKQAGRRHDESYESSLGA